MATPWIAPHATAPIAATVSIPGSKSMTNRALLLSALAQDRSTIEGVLRARDTELMTTGLQTLGCEVIVDADTVVLTPPAHLRGGGTIDCGLAGTVMRFLPPVAALADSPVRFDGDARARERPLRPLLQALQSLGVDIEGHSLPITVHGHGCIAGGSVTIDSSASSQLVSGLLLIGARCDAGLTVRHRGQALPSLPHVDMTVAMLRERGAQVSAHTEDPTDCEWRVEPGALVGGDYLIEPDLSNAGPFLAAAMLTGGEITVPGWPATTDQAGDAYRELFTRMGARIHLDDAGLTLVAPPRIRGIDADMSQVGELVPTVAAVAAFADGPTRLSGVAHLRGHETDRIAALATELRRVGCTVEEHADGITIEPAELHAEELQCYEDHRMATFAAIIGLRVPGTTVSDIAATTKTLPDFPLMWRSMLASA